MKQGFILLFLIFTLQVIFTCQPGFSQFNKDTKYIGVAANVNLNRSNEKYENPTSQFRSSGYNIGFSVSPDLAFSFKNNLATGIKLNYSYERYENRWQSPSGSSYRRSVYTNLSFSPYLRYYKNITPNMILYAELRAESGYGLIKDGYSADPIKKWGEKWNSERFFYGTGIRPGVLFFVTKKMAIDLQIGSLGYSSERIKAADSSEPDINTVNNFYISFNDLWFGIKFFFLTNSSEPQKE